MRNPFGDYPVGMADRRASVESAWKKTMAGFAMNAHRDKSEKQKEIARDVARAKKMLPAVETKQFRKVLDTFIAQNEQNGKRKRVLATSSSSSSTSSTE